MNTVRFYSGHPLCVPSKYVRLELSRRWYAVCKLSKEVLHRVYEKLEGHVHRSHKLVFRLSFEKVGLNTYLLKLDVLEAQILTILNNIVKEALSEVLGEGYPIPPIVLPPSTREVVHSLMKMESRKCLGDRVIEADTIYAKVKITDFERFMEEGKRCLENVLKSVLSP